MFPISLTIEGLYSYKKRHHIDFTKLTQAGVFGIFGKVGSGKSSILEAITYALYGESDRLNKKDDRNYNMMNLESDKLNIVFEFLAGEKGEHFECSVLGKRNSKQFDKVNTYKRSLAKKVNGNWQAIEQSELEQIIGLSYENFRRTVIIPQGKFAEFLQLTSTPRVAMIKDIFNLYEYDLHKPTSNLASQTKEKLGQCQVLMENKYEDISPESVEENKNKLGLLEKEILSDQKQIKNKEEHYQSLKLLKSVFEEKEKIRKQLDDELSLREKMQERKAMLKKYRYLKEYFLPLIQEENRLHLEKKKVEQQQQMTEKERASLSKELSHLQASSASLQKQLHTLEQEQKWLPLLEQFLELKELQYQYAEKGKRVENSKQYIDNQTQKNHQISEKIAQIKSEIIFIKKEQIPLEELLQTQHGYEKLESLESTWVEQQATFQKQQKQKEEYQNQCKKLSSELKKVSKNQLENTKQKIEQQINRLTMQQGLQQAVEHLKDDEPCPVCGSAHHPDILDLENLEAQTNKLTTEKQAVEQKLSNYQELEREHHYLQQRILEKHKELGEWQQKTESALEQLTAYRKSFHPKKEWTKAVLNSLIQDQEKLKAKLKKAEENLSEQEQQLDREKQTLEKWTNEVEKLRRASAMLSGQITSLEKSVTSVPNEYKEKTDIRAWINQFEENFQKTKQISEQNFIKEQQVSQQTSQLEGKQESLLTQNKALLKNQKQNQVEIENFLNKSDFQSKEAAQAILQKQLDTEKEEQQINQHENSVSNLRERLSKLEEKIKGQTFDAAFFEETESQIKTLQKRISQQTEEKGALQKQIRQTEKDLVQKKELEKEITLLEQKAINLNELEKLFKGNGFVNYASTDYLQNLCALANQRFKELTYQQLELVLNEENDFLIRDYLNEGKTRSIKTLSGGQLFQASLSMALALSESMKKQQQFFFLDEGFGALDDESLQTVLKTLESLQNEQKIVGIISHVESLQQEIQTHLFVEKTEREGSGIKLRF